MRGFTKDRSPVPPWAWALAGAGAAAAVMLARRRARQSPRELVLRAAITIQAPAARVYELWRNPQTHAQLRQAKVTPLADDGTSWHWRRDFAHGGYIQGDVHLTREQPPEWLEWSTENLQIQFRPGLPVRHLSGPGPRQSMVPRGSLQLLPRPRQSEPEATEVRLRLAVRPAPPLPWIRTRIGAGMDAALHRLRMLAETGALATTAGQPTGVRSHKGRLLLRVFEQSAAQPVQKVS